jgi:hypothetical protein
MITLFIRRERSVTFRSLLPAAMLCAAALVLAGPALAQPKPVPHIDYIEIVSAGFDGPGERVKRGKFREKFFTRTMLRTGAQVGTKFTVAVRPMGQPEGAEVALRFVWRTPRPGIKDAKTGKFSREIAEDATAKLGEEIQKTFEFRSEEQLVKGTWRAEVWSGKRKIATRRFALR